MAYFVKLVSREGLEPSTPSLRGSCSNQLSYRPNKTKTLYHTLGFCARVWRNFIMKRFLWLYIFVNIL